MHKRKRKTAMAKKKGQGLEGSIPPIEFDRDTRGGAVVIKGHRRVSALRALAEQGVPGFGPDMRITAVEVPRPRRKGKRGGPTDGV
jgi:hypothetical protein